MQRYPLSAGMQAFIEQTRAFGVADPALAAQRAAYSRMAAAFTPPCPGGVQVRDLNTPGLVPLRVFQPAQAAPAGGWPALLFMHGGGWMLGGLDSHAFFCAELTARLGVAVVAVDYRLAPEYPFPAGLDDSLAVWRALRDGALDVPIDPTRLVVIGDSAGGNLAAALCLALREADEPQPRMQALIYPALGDEDSVSRRECADAPLLSVEDMQACLNAYLPFPARSPLALPLLADDFTGLAPAFIAVAEFDPLRDDGLRYAQRLEDDGVAVDYFPGHGLVHGCLRARDLPEVEQLYEALFAALENSLD
ncbi:alpha/beta hydrolase [Pseudomonas putida]|uniref:alpha/beta hydrolase n=1 Tax=Pseudomonas putida TaxID=303 RepID=UPI00081922A8|nr:alpha/beta hydrolase [Pseudomonas putida]OCT27928.1 lipase [Pseudomonas putida]OCT32426.1 lipase [Pseudomonas putida]OCT36823.1 lipase [Pseudomonas putida]OCT38703.1 lipase [Pseudomonas putida]